MFFRCRRRSPLLTLLLIFLGVKWLRKEQPSDEERAEFRAKRKAFRHKMREAFAVWDDEETESTEEA